MEARLTAADGSTFDADVVFFDPSFRARVILEVSVITIGSDTPTLHWGEARELGWMRASWAGWGQRTAETA